MNICICLQLYVRGSIEAVEFYKKAFGGFLGAAHFFQDGTPEDGYHHAEIKVGERTVLALCENERYTSGVATGHPIMQFNISGLETKEAVLQAYRVLSEGAVENENPDGPVALPWNEYCFTLIDKYNIWWWIAI